MQKIVASNDVATVSAARKAIYNLNQGLKVDYRVSELFFLQVALAQAWIFSNEAFVQGEAHWAVIRERCY
jgi:hypothetical protein